MTSDSDDIKESCFFLLACGIRDMPCVIDWFINKSKEFADCEITAISSSFKIHFTIEKASFRIFKNVL